MPKRATEIVSSTLTGKIYRLVRDRGFGFLRTDDGRDWFFHRSELRNTTFENVAEGMQAEFLPVPDAPKGARATEIHVL